MDECFRHRKELADEFKSFQKVFAALGDESRQQIFLTLLENDIVGMRVCQIMQKVNLSRPAISHHLQILKKAGLINMHKQGTMNYYYVDTSTQWWSGLDALATNINSVIKSAKQSGYPWFKED